MFGQQHGRLTAIIINLIGTLLTLYLLLQIDNVFYALLIILFSLSVSATQCRRRLLITLPVLICNAGIVLTGFPYSIYLLYVISSTGHAVDISVWIEPVVVFLFTVVSFINALIIRNLHYPPQGSLPQGEC